MRLRASRGFTLIELVIAVAILAIGTMAAYRSFDQAQRGVGGQVARTLAHEVAMNRAAELRLRGMAAGRGLPDRERMGRLAWRIAVEERATAGGLIEARIAVTAPGQPGAQVVVHAPEAAP